MQGSKSPSWLVHLQQSTLLFALLYIGSKKNSDCGIFLSKSAASPISFRVKLLQYKQKYSCLTTTHPKLLDHLQAIRKQQFGIQAYFNPNRKNIFQMFPPSLKMEDGINFFKYGRQPWVFKNEEDSKLFRNGRGPPFKKWKMISNLIKVEDDLNFFSGKWKMIPPFPPNPRDTYRKQTCLNF